MTIVEVAENIQKELDIEGVKSQKIRDLISQLVDLAINSQVMINKNMQNIQTPQCEIDKLIAQLAQKQNALQKIQVRMNRDLERIELMLYEKNEFKILKDVIDFIKALKTSTIRASFCDTASQISQPNMNEEAFYCSNSMNVHNTFILCQQENQKLQEIVQTINKSSISLSQKEQLVYNIIKSQTNQSQLQHVNLEDILDVSYNPLSKKLNTSILSSIPIQTEQNILNKLNQKLKFEENTNNKSQEFTLDDDEMESPKFQFAELSPIKSKSSTSRLKKKEEFFIDSFQKQPYVPKVVKVPRINLESLQKRESSNKKNSNSLNPKQDIIKKRPKQLSYGDKQSFYDKSSILNVVSNINRSKDTKDTDKQRSDSNNSRARYQTFHTAQPQSQFLKDLMQKIHRTSKDLPQQPNKKVSEYEKKQLSLLSINQNYISWQTQKEVIK